MNRFTKHFIIWAPRVLCIAFAGFLSIFAFDVFSEPLGFWQIAQALLIHLIPAFLVLVVLIVSWRWELVGGIIFTALGILYLINSWGRFPWVTYLLVSGPLLLAGILFLVSWAMKSKLRTS